MSSSTTRYWLLKAEPETRVVKGKDVKFSVDDFEHVGTSPWEGVRNYEARNLMKEMKEGDKALFYHSNCKTPGIAAFAQVSKEAYPDYTAWDSSHPYYDAKSDSKDPKWFMVDLTFVSRAKNFVPLALLRKISTLPVSDIPEEISYVGETGTTALKSMDLVTRGRLSVQRVGEDAWKAIEQLAEKGGWEDMDLRPTATATKKRKQNRGSDDGPSKKVKAAPKRKGKPAKPKDLDQEDAEEAVDEPETPSPTQQSPGLRRSTRKRT
ncbi:hypothetical protein M413DRAFT_449863 [Hebeloma cylindrosporum]|uniref:EVE domain-containing protein n=1 Tax=Hebeloma cylindrosporum TaxID=76867 RepID=A0A0C3BEG1_HEBCY|nr:hypothetical protein M413DRAFT_449863 [Hebeloma cylindrosporum h7]